MKPIPTFSEDLIKDLDKDLPERCPDTSMSEKEVWFYAGKRAVVRSLITRLEQDTNLTSPFIKKE